MTVLVEVNGYSKYHPHFNIDCSLKCEVMTHLFILFYSDCVFQFLFMSIGWVWGSWHMQVK